MKRAQTGNLIATMFVLIFLFIIMAFFVFTAAGVSVLRKPAPPEASFDSYQNNGEVLLEDLKLSLDNDERRVLLADAIMIYGRNKIEKNTFIESLKKILTEDNNCIVIAKGLSPNPAGMKGGEAIDDILIELKNGEYVAGHTGSTPLILSRYSNAGVLSNLDFKNSDGETVYVEFYYGGCLDE